MFKKCFTVPLNLVHLAKDITCLIVDSIPQGWVAVRGTLNAPTRMLASREILASTKLVFASQVDQIFQETSGDQAANPIAILFQGKEPRAIEFCNRGYVGDISMEQTKYGRKGNL